MTTVLIGFLFYSLGVIASAFFGEWLIRRIPGTYSSYRHFFKWAAALWTWPISLPLLWLTDPRSKSRTALQALNSHCQEPGDWDLLDNVLRSEEIRLHRVQDTYKCLREEHQNNDVDWAILSNLLEIPKSRWQKLMDLIIGRA